MYRCRGQRFCDNRNKAFVIKSVTRRYTLFFDNSFYLSLRIVEVGRYSDHCFCDGVSEECVSRLLHLGQDHGRDFLGEKGLHFTLVFGLDLGLAAIADDLQDEVKAIFGCLSVEKILCTKFKLFKFVSNP